MADNVSEAAGRADEARAGRVSSSIARLRAELEAVGGPSPLLHFSDARVSRIDLSTAHPSGMAQFISGKTTALTSLVRDELALRNARAAADLLARKGIELKASRGIESIAIASGLARWSFGGEEFSAPIVLRPVAIRRRGHDFELRLRGRARLNPALARALREQFDLPLDAAAYAALVDDGDSFAAIGVAERLTREAGPLGLHAEPRLFIASLAEVGPAMARDITPDALERIEALGAAGSRDSHLEPAELIRQDERPPSTDTLLLDADSEQEAVIAHIASGASVKVIALPGTGATQTLINALGALVGQGRRVLVVSPRASTLASVRARFDELGLKGLVAAPASLKRDLIKSIQRNEHATKPNTAEVDDALTRLRHVLVDYRTALFRVDRDLGVSVIDALSELARLSLLDPAPATTARLDRRSLTLLAGDRDDAADKLVKAAELGQFRYGPGDSPWYGAVFPSAQTAEDTHELAKRLHSVAVPRFIDEAARVLEPTHLRAFTSIADLGRMIELVLDVRDSLDAFSPAVFDRPLDALIEATEHGGVFASAEHRRLRKLAREYIRPGASVPNLHEALIAVKEQRAKWNRYVDIGSRPIVPPGITDLARSYEQVSNDLSVLDAPLSSRSRESRLAELPLPELRERLKALAADSDVLRNLQERQQLVEDLEHVSLEPLLADLSERHVPSDEVAHELELAWWQSALEELLANEKALLNANTRVLDRLEADFKLVDEHHAAASAEVLAHEIAERWKIAIIDNPTEADALRELLRQGAVTSETLFRAAPRLSRILAPIWVASPYEVPSIDASMPFDTTVLLDAGALTAAEAIGSVRRGKQLVMFGDDVTQTPSDFRIAITDDDAGFSPVVTEARIAALHEASALNRLGAHLPSLKLNTSYRAGGEDLTELVNQRFYGGRIESVPWAGTFLGHSSLAFSYVEHGRGLPDAQTGAVEATDAEVQRVVELVVDHAVHRPRESLMVITASQKHAVRVQQALLSVASQRHDLASFFTDDRAEPLLVATLEQAVSQSRDRVIFSVGYGLTPHGRLLSDFGALAAPGGERLVAIAMTRPRRALTVVSCFHPQDIDPERMQHGIVTLAELLTQAAASKSDGPFDIESEPLLVDLAARLQRRGMRVKLWYRGKIALAASYGGRAIAIETDGMMNSLSLRESLRLRPALLKRLGWYYLRVHSFELFTDPDAVAERIATALRVPAEGGGAAAPGASAR